MRNPMTKLMGLVIVAALLAILVPEEVWARAGGGGSMGSRGSRSFSSPSRTYSAPAPSTSSQPSTQTRPAPAPGPMTQPAPAGGFMRSLAGGVMGGLLGGMLFRSLGFAGGPGDGVGGGFGLMDLLLLAGIAYLIFWFVRRNRGAQAAPATAYSGSLSADAYGSGGATATVEAPSQSWQQDLERGLGHIRQMDPGFDEAAFREMCTDRFFQIQAAWMRRDREKLRPLLTDEMADTFGKHIDIARSKRQINKLENITVRSVEPTEAWQEQGQDYITVRLLANLLDYTVDETTGKVVDGSDSGPVKFEEYWTWVRPVGRTDWRLSAINQAE
jgi:predicted lipid-binding transport protein (Tim44 family)